jgi:hypothetical protein
MGVVHSSRRSRELANGWIVDLNRFVRPRSNDFPDTRCVASSQDLERPLPKGGVELSVRVCGVGLQTQPSCPVRLTLARRKLASHWTLLFRLRRVKVSALLR